MQFIALLRRRTEKFADSDFAPLLPEESQQRRSLYAQGFARQVWNRTDEPGTAFLFEATDRDEVHQHLNTLPLVQAEMMEITTVASLAPYPGFGPTRK
jgi:muconolactone delta-isomerase